MTPINNQSPDIHVYRTAHPYNDKEERKTRQQNAKPVNQFDIDPMEKQILYTEENKHAVNETQNTESDRRHNRKMDESRDQLGYTVDESATRVDIKENQYSALKEEKQIKVDASMYSGVSSSARKGAANAFNEGLKMLGAG